MASIDVAIPNYQYGRYLRDCVQSVLSQGVADLRILIIDNASTDNSAEVAQQLAAQDKRICFVRHRANLGHHASFNEAIDWAEADYFLLLCADDMLTTGALSRALAVMDRDETINLAFANRAALTQPHLASRSSDIGARWDVMPGRALLERFCRTALCSVVGCSAVVRTAAQKRVGYYRMSLDHTDDFELLMRLAVLDGNIAETRTPQVFLRSHDEARSAVVRRNRSLQIRKYEAAFTSFFAHEGRQLPDAEALQRLARRSLASRAYWSGVSHLCRGDFANAAGLLRYAVQRSRSTAFVPPIDYLFRQERVLERAAGALEDGLQRLHLARRAG